MSSDAIRDGSTTDLLVASRFAELVAANRILDAQGLLSEDAIIVPLDSGPIYGKGPVSVFMLDNMRSSHLGRKMGGFQYVRFSIDEELAAMEAGSGGRGAASSSGAVRDDGTTRSRNTLEHLRESLRPKTASGHRSVSIVEREGWINPSFKFIDMRKTFVRETIVVRDHLISVIVTQRKL